MPRQKEREESTRASSESLKKYLKEISRLSRITKEEEKVLGPCDDIVRTVQLIFRYDFDLIVSVLELAVDYSLVWFKVREQCRKCLEVVDGDAIRVSRS